MQEKNISHILGNSETEIDIKDHTQEMIDISEGILNTFKNKFGEESKEFQRIQKEYSDLKQSIENAINNDQKITQQELTLIKLEYSQIKQLENGNERSMLDRLSTTARETFKQDTKTLQRLGVDVTHTNAYQEELIEGILGGNKGYGNGFLHGFRRSQGGNFVISIADFENQLKNNSIENINSKALGNYILYLNSEGQLTQKELISKIGIQNLIDLKKIWFDKTGTNIVGGVAKKMIKEKNIDIKEIIKVSTFFRSPDDFFDKIDDISKKFSKKNGDKSMELLGNIFEAHGQEIEAKFGKYLFEKIQQKNPHLTDIQIKEILKNFDEKISNYKGDYSKLPEIYIAFGELSKKYDLGLNVKEAVKEKLMSDTFKIVKNMNLLQKRQKVVLEELENIPSELNFLMTQLPHLNGLQKEKTLEKIRALGLERVGYEKENGEITKKLDGFILQMQGHGVTSQLNNALSDDIVNQIIESQSEEEAKEIFNQEVEKIISTNENIKITLQKYEQQKAEFEKKYPPIVEEKSEETKNIPQNLATNLRDIPKPQTQNELISLDGSYTLKTPHKEIPITLKEAEMIQNNPEAEKNLINFKNTLDELHISNLWDFRDDIFNILRDEYPILFNENDTFLSEQEVVIFLNSLLASVDLKAYNSPHINTLKSNFWITNNISVLGGTNRENQTNGNTSIEQKFLNTFCPITNNGRFESAKFRQAIS